MPKNYLVAGGSSGIGLDLVKRLVEHGHNVTVVSRTSEALQGMAGVAHIAHDFVEEGQPSLNADSLDGLVYCPGTINLKPFRGLKEKDFLHDFRVNVLGAINCIQAASSALKKGTNPSIVLFSTVAVAQGMKYHASVASAKGAVEGLARSLAAEFAPSIRVNCIAPSVVDTPLASRILSSDDRKEASAKRHPLERVGDAGDIAAMAEFLLSDQSGWMTGQVLGIDGGMSAVKML
ncbi:MAG: SDR family oxidoreductase [Bacteroidota bacterium]